MSSDPIAPADDLARAAELPQADAGTLVDREMLEAQVKDMYRRVAREEDAQLHFALGRRLALRVGYPREPLDAIPTQALASFARVGYHLDLAQLGPETRCSISAPAREPMRSAPPSRSARQGALVALAVAGLRERDLGGWVPPLEMAGA